MELAKYKACICEGSAEEAIIDILVDNDLLIFNREEMLEERVIRCRSAKRFEERYLRKGFDEQISVIRILDSRREEFRLSKAYEQKIDVVNVITAPEIEMLIIHAEGAYLDCEAPYLTVRRAWHTEHNRPVILTELKTKAAHRNVPLPDNLLECLKEAKKTSTSDFVVANRDGDPLSYTQFKRLWQYIVTRTTKERCYYRYEDGKRVKHTVKPVLGQKAAHNGNVVYSLDFEVTPHQLRHTYITNLIHASVDPKTVQYLAGHESSKITMDIYAKVKYNRPEQLAGVLEDAFASWD